MIPHWTAPLAWAFLALGWLCTVAVAWDILIGGHRQTMRVMEAVWPITAVYFGPVGVWGYRRLGRARSPKDTAVGGERSSPAWYGEALSASHCGAGCVLGDIVGGWTIFATGWVLAGERLYAEYVLEFVFAWLFGIVFQYLSIKPAHPWMPPSRALWDAVKADTLSILAFQVGMYAWMALAMLVLFAEHLPIDGPVFWFMMQIGLVVGFFTTYPVNRWLVRRGIKGGM